MRYVLGILLALALVATFAQLFLDLIVHAHQLFQMLCSASAGELVVILGVFVLAGGLVAYIFRELPQSNYY